MELVGRGWRIKDIAATLGMSTGTVKIHLKHIFEKTGIRGRCGLALAALQQKDGFRSRALIHRDEARCVTNPHCDRNQATQPAAPRRGFGAVD